MYNNIKNVSKFLNDTKIFYVLKINIKKNIDF